MVRYSLGQHVFLYDTYVKYGSAKNVSGTFYVNFMMKEFPADKQFTIWGMN
jgi:hypothetical protein